MNSFPLNHVELSSSEKSAFLAIMLKGNPVLAKWHETIQPDALATGKEHYNRQDFRGDLFRQDMKKPVVMYGHEIPQDDLKLIMDVRKCELPMLQGHAKLMDKLARKGKRLNEDAPVDLEDFYGEALTAGMNAVYCFNRENMAFSSYLTHAVQRRMLTVSNNNKPLSHWPGKVQELQSEFERTKASCNGPVDFDELVKIMGLKPKQIKLLQKLTAKLVLESEWNKPDGSHDYGHHDGLLAATAVKSPLELDHDQREAIEKAQLDEWEKAVLEAFLQGGTGWRSAVAKEHINPTTGKNYSRMATSIALKRIVSKVQEIYEPSEAA